MKKILVVLFFSLVFPTWAQNPPESDTFLNRTFSNWDLMQKSASPQVETPFFPLQGLIRGQDAVSVQNIISEKYSTRLANKDFTWNATQNRWSFAYDGGRSVVPATDPIIGIRGPQGIVIIDGHHDLVLSVFLGAKTIPVQIKEDLSKLSPLEFWQNLKQRNLVYLKDDAKALASALPQMTRMQDSPNRYLATLLAMKVLTQEVENDQLKVSSINKSKNSIWIKLNQSVPFIEFHIAKILSDAGIRYDAKWGKDLPVEIVEQARCALLDAKLSGGYPQLKRIAILDSSQEAMQANMNSEWLTRVLEKQSGKSCKKVFNK